MFFAWLRAQATPGREPAPSGYRRGSPLLLFVAGLLSGVAIARHAPHEAPVAPVSAQPIEADPVRGVDADGRLPRALARLDATELPEYSPRRLDARQRPRAADVARHALGFTVYVHGGGVYGAGVVIDRRGYVVTCRHVIDGLSAIAISFADGRSAKASVVETDAKLDLALLKIDGDPPSFAAVTAASIASVETGDDLFTMGAPRKMKFTLSRGMASFIGRRFEDVFYLQTDLALNGGSSGGPVMNARGQVVALSSFVLKDSEGLAFALPIDYVYQRFEPWLGRSRNGAGGAAFDRWLGALHKAKAPASAQASSQP